MWGNSVIVFTWRNDSEGCEDYTGIYRLTKESRLPRDAALTAEIWLRVIIMQTEKGFWGKDLVLSKEMQETEDLRKPG